MPHNHACVGLMSHKHRDQLTTSGEWAKHLRPHHRRAFWKRERRAYSQFVRGEAVGSNSKPPWSSDASASLAPAALYYIAMPVKVRELIARLEADGWFLVRQKGSHRQYRHATKAGTVTVAGKPSVDIPPGTLNSILKQAGLKK